VMVVEDSVFPEKVNTRKVVFQFEFSTNMLYPLVIYKMPS
jgi:hypothetical protein